MLRKLITLLKLRKQVREERGREVEGTTDEVEELDPAWGDGSGFGVLTSTDEHRTTEDL